MPAARINSFIADNEAPSLDDFQWLLSIIRKLRPDLLRLFHSGGQVNLAFMRWLISSGLKEYSSLLPVLRQVLNRRVRGLGLTSLQALIYMERKDVQKAYPLPECADDVRAWFYRHGVDEHKILRLLEGDELKNYRIGHPESQEISSEIETVDRPFGVNLVGYAYGQLGIGEDLRMTAKALRSANVPFAILNFAPGRNVPQNDYSMAEYVAENGPYKFNLFCMTALETARYYAEKGSGQFKNRYNIGYWPWELAKWPTEWRDLTKLVDEVWVSSRHIYDALSPVSTVPVLIMPLAVEVGEISSLGRKDFGLPEDAYIFCFSFDLNSSIHRKNPKACLKAFLMAFPKEEEANVALVIKCHKPAKPDKNWDAIKLAAAGDERIFIVEETLSRPDLMALYSACDCYLSLHRAEGYGRGIAEALLLGLRVIATGYSGNVDYCREHPEARLTPYTFIPVGNGQYPYNTAQVWAEPDIESCVAFMRDAAIQTTENDSEAINCLLPGIKSIGNGYSRRLKFLWSKIKENNHAAAL